MIRGTVAASLVVLAVTACGRSGGDEPIAAEPPPTSEAPVATTPTTIDVAVPDYVVQSGDSLSGLADRFGVTVTQIAELNEITDLDSITAGDTLAIPQSTSTTTTARTNRPSATSTSVAGSPTDRDRPRTAATTDVGADATTATEE